MAVVSLPPTGFKVLRALNTYRFLTVKQMVRLGVATDEGNLRKVLRGMVSAKRDKNGIPLPKEIGLIEFGVLPRVGRLSRLHFLAKKGAKLLAEVDPEGEEPKPVLHVVRFQNDYFHKVNTIDIHITVRQFAEATGQEITLNRQYFNRLPKIGRTPPRPSTSIDLRPGFIDPDSVYMLRDCEGTERLLLVEIANGMNTNRVVEKISKYSDAIANNKINDAFRLGQRAPRVLWLFEHQRTLELVQRNATDHPRVQASLPYFFMRTIDSCVVETFQRNWERPSLGKEPVSLY